MLSSVLRAEREGGIVGEGTYTFSVDEQLLDAFARAAEASDRSGAQILREFMGEYVSQLRDEAEYDAWFRREVQAGLASAAEGRLIPAAEVETHFAAKRAVTRRRLGTAG
jgi:predicted transcriptional regulator